MKELKVYKIEFNIKNKVKYCLNEYKFDYINKEKLKFRHVMSRVTNFLRLHKNQHNFSN